MTQPAIAAAFGVAPSGADDQPLAASKNQRLKFLCSYGGKILPSPADGRLKYAGGDTRVLAVSRTISFFELKRKIEDMCGPETVIKYQLARAEELDVLVSVAGDEDLVYMIEEYDRLDALHPTSPSSTSSPRFRLYLFPPSSSSSAAASSAARGERRSSALSSAATSPTSTMDGPAAALLKQRMQRIHSTPNLRNGGVPATPATCAGINHQHHQQQHPQAHHQQQHPQAHHQQQHPPAHHHQRHSHRQHSAPPVSDCGSGCCCCGPWRMARPAFRYDMCDCGPMMLMEPLQAQMVSGGYYYPPMAMGKPEESPAISPVRTSNAVSPLIASGPSSPVSSRT